MPKDNCNPYQHLFLPFAGRPRRAIVTSRQNLLPSRRRCTCVVCGLLLLFPTLPIPPDASVVLRVCLDGTNFCYYDDGTGQGLSRSRRFTIRENRLFVQRQTLFVRAFFLRQHCCCLPLLWPPHPSLRYVCLEPFPPFPPPNKPLYDFEGEDTSIQKYEEDEKKRKREKKSILGSPASKQKKPPSIFASRAGEKHDR